MVDCACTASRPCWTMAWAITSTQGRAGSAASAFRHGRRRAGAGAGRAACASTPGGAARGPGVPAPRRCRWPRASASARMWASTCTTPAGTAAPTGEPSPAAAGWFFLEEAQEGAQVGVVRALEAGAVRGDAVQQQPGRMFLAAQQAGVLAGQAHDGDLQAAHQHFERRLQAVVGQDLVQLEGDLVQRRGGRRRGGGALGQRLELALAQIGFLERAAVAGQQTAELGLAQLGAELRIDRLELDRQRVRGDAHQRGASFRVQVHALDRARQRLREDGCAQRLGTGMVLDGGDDVRDRDVPQRLVLVHQAELEVAEVRHGGPITVQRIPARACDASSWFSDASRSEANCARRLEPAGQQLVVLQAALELILNAVVERMRQRRGMGQGGVDDGREGGMGRWNHLGVQFSAAL
ncbi:hypothetical protein Ddc_22128 [Ditylenchus destructor]|nr:hypothetical protein Ddc_22128 [Ditylenchus destructor]